MRSSELFVGSNFAVSAGQAPDISALDAETDSHACDWADEARAPKAETGGLLRDAKVQSLVLKFWELFSKGEDNTISPAEYHGFLCRVARVFLPGLSAAQEMTLSENSWKEASGGAPALSFAPFFCSVVRLAQSWTAADGPKSNIAFLEDLLQRITRVQVTVFETGEVYQEEPMCVVNFRRNAQYEAQDPGDCEFGTCIDMVCQGDFKTVNVKANFDAPMFGQEWHICWYRESLVDTTSTLMPGDATSRMWAPLDSIIPLGSAAVKALQMARAQGEKPFILDCTNAKRKADANLAAASVLKELIDGDEISVEVNLSQNVAMIAGTETVFGLQELLSMGLVEGVTSNQLLVRPEKGLILWKLRALRDGLLLEQPSATLAAMSSGQAAAPLTLPTFTDVLAGKSAVDGESGLVQQVKKESLLQSGSLSTLAEAFISPEVTFEPAKPTVDAFAPLSIDKGKPASDSFTAHFPSLPNELTNDKADVLNLAHTAPLAIWVLGQCDNTGSYKTEVCRRLSQKLGLQWLQPSFVLELSVKTPVTRRTPLMKRCVEQLQRGMTVSLSDALRLTLEMIASAPCKTNGYILDFPTISPEEAQEVAQFAEKVKELSASTEVRWEELLADDVTLPALKPEPEPPKPPPAEGEEGEAPAEEAPPDEAPPADEAAADAAPVEEAEVKEEAPPPPPPMVPNPLANCLPRRVVVLSMDKDNVPAWRLTTLKMKHAQKAKRRKELEEAGEEVPEDEEEEAEELPALPEDEEEQKELFEKMAGDILQTMGPFLKLPSLEPPKTLPPVPDDSQEIVPETTDRASMKKGEDKAIKAMQKTANLPLLSLHLDGRTPEAAADLLELVTGKGPGFRVPLPMPLEGAGDEAKELLRLNLGERQASRRWSPWRLHCPVSLSEKKLTPGSNEFAVDYAGYVFLFADVAKQREFCNWPKRFLTDAPTINAPGMHLGYSVLSPCGFRTSELAGHLNKAYGFDAINVVSLLERALVQPPMPEDLPEGTVPDEDAEPVAKPAAGEPWLTKEEHQTLTQGKPLSTNTAIRLIAYALGVEANLAIIKQQGEDLEAAKKKLEDASAAGAEPPEDVKLDDDGVPIIPLSAPLSVPSRGFVLENFPESVEQFEALKSQLRLDIEQVLLLKPGGEEAPEVLEQLKEQGLHENLPLEPILETQLANFEALAGVEGLRIAEVALEASEEHQFVQIRKHIDPFYQVVEDPTMAADIPDPDEWTPEEVDPEAEGEDAEPQERPVIPWGTCGMYCPVTLKEQRWLYPGQKDFQHSYNNRVFATANEAASEAFLREPVKYVPVEKEPILPPPRIMVTGPTGSGVSKQCEMLSEVYKIPVLKLEEAWRAKINEKLQVFKDAKKEAARKEALEQPMTNDEGLAWPDGWLPPVEKPPAEEGEEEEAPPEPEPEDDGLDDEQREVQFVLAMKDVLGSHSGACIIDGTWFKDLEDEEMAEEVRTARSLQNLLTKAQRIPDLTVVLRCKNDFAAKNTFDFEAIDKEHQERVAAYQKLVAEAEAKEEDPPEQPEGLVIDEEQKESDRVKEKFFEKKTAQQQLLKDLSEALGTARAPLQKVASERGDVATHKAVRWHCRPFVEQRTSLLLRQQISKVSPSKVADLTRRGLAQHSRFSSANPMFVDTPTYPGRGEAFKFAALLRGRIFFPQNEAELAQILERPADFLSLPDPSRVNVNPAIAIAGPPLAGKTVLAKQLALRTGAVYISMPEVVSEFVAESSLPFALSQQMLAAMKSGKEVPLEALIMALRHRVAAPDVVKRGWILDDFPLSVEHAEAMTAGGIVPHRVLMINVPEPLIFARGRALGSAKDAAMEQQEAAFQRDRLKSYEENAPSMRSYYDLCFHSVRDLDGSRSAWAVFDHALRETNESVTQRLAYYRRTAQGMAAMVRGMCFSPGRLAACESAWKRYCPVTLSLGNELLECLEQRFAVEYKSKVYWMASAEYAKLFFDDPESFMQVPLPENVPHLLNYAERQQNVHKLIELEEYCPVTLVDKKELVKGSGHHIVNHGSSLYSFCSKEASAKFLRRPHRFVALAKLPSKKPANPGANLQAASLLSSLTKGKDGRGLQPGDMLTYMQASVAETICQALVDSGERRPLYPGKGPQESALTYLSRFLRAKNSVNTEMYSETVRKQREDFLSDCALPAALKEMTRLKESPDYVWTAQDTVQFKELCARFDKVFA